MKEITIKNVVLALCLLGGLSVKGQANLSIEDFYIMSGETKMITIDMTNSVEIRAFQVLVDLPEHIKMVSRPTIITKRQGCFTDEFGQKVDSKKTLSYKIHEDGSCMIVVNANDAVPFSGSEGAVITLTLKANKDVFSDVSECVELKNMELVYADGYTCVRPSDISCSVDIYGSAMSVKELQEIKRDYVDVYNICGQIIRKRIFTTELEKYLPNGIYVIEGMKVLVNK